MKEKRLYGLFEQQDGKWVRLYSGLAFKKTHAVNIFQGSLLAPYMNGIDGIHIKGIRELKVVKN